MVANPVFSETPKESQKAELTSLEDFLLHPPEYTEWVDGKLIEKNGMTFKHGVAQFRLDYHCRTYMNSSGQGGEVCTETLCRTERQARRPDVAYVTAELLEEVGEFRVFPQSFPLIVEVASPEDSAEALFAKAGEYMESGCLEVWLLFPEAGIILINTQQGWLLRNFEEVVSTQTVLTGFSTPVKELLV